MPKPRTASLRVAHKTSCANATRTSLDSLDGCNCKPSYYTFHRAHGHPEKGPRVNDRRVAERALRKLQVELEEGRANVGVQRRRKSRTFDQWTAEYLANIETDKQDKGTTVRAYQSTLGYASPVLGPLDLTEIGLGELRQIVRAIRANPAGGSDATVHKHLRHLRAILTAAVEEGYADTNPLSRKFLNDLRLKIPKNVESYTDTELAKLFAQMDALGYEPVYVFAARAILATGSRVGEIVALDCDDLSLTDGVLEIQKHYDGTDGITLPKHDKTRTHYLLADPNVPYLDAVSVFEEWIAHTGVRDGHAPLFPAPRSGDRLNADYVRKLIIKAREEAGIPLTGEGGRPRKPLHALRGSYTRLARENGYPTWLIQHNLGHSTPILTENVYGTISTDALRNAARAAVAA